MQNIEPIKKIELKCHKCSAKYSIEDLSKNFICFCGTTLIENGFHKITIKI